jgi:hypothetical protein
MPLISPDSYIRLTPEQLQALPLQHLISGMDEDHPPLAGSPAMATAISGYTEWVSAEAPRVSLGWDWELQLHDASVRLRRVGLPRSNVMLLGPDQADLGPDATAALLARLVDGMAWQDTTWNNASAPAND